MFNGHSYFITILFYATLKSKSKIKCFYQNQNYILYFRFYTYKKNFFFDILRNFYLFFYILNGLNIFTLRNKSGLLE